MGRCIHCGESAGWFRSVHQACADRADEELREHMERRAVARRAEDAVRKQQESARDGADALYLIAITEGGNLEEAHHHAQIAYAQAGITDPRASMIAAFERAVEHIFADGLFDQREEDAVVAFSNVTGIPPKDLDRNGAWTKVTKGGVLRDLCEGTPSSRQSIIGSLPFALLKSEALVWVEPNVRYYEQKVRRTFEGRSSGVSIRIAKGVYYRVGAFKGHPVEQVSTELADIGFFGISNRHVFFAGGRQSFRIDLKKIASVQPHEDGVTLTKDTATAKPQAFVTGDGWFAYNAIMNLIALR
jgi:hypothetical protein